MNEINEELDAKKVFGDKLRFLREKEEISQSALAKLLDIKQNSLSNYERGKQFPEVPLIKKLANFFGITVDELLSESNDAADQTIKKHKELILDLQNGLSLEEIASKQSIVVDGKELPIEQKKAILEQIEFQYRKWQESI